MSAIASRISGRRSFPVAASTSIKSLAPALLNAGYLVPVSVNAGTYVGVTEWPITNDGAAGALYAEINASEWKYKNVGDITVANVGSAAYFSNESTVSISDATATRPDAGKITQVDSDGVWVIPTI